MGTSPAELHAIVWKVELDGKQAIGGNRSETYGDMCGHIESYAPASCLSASQTQARRQKYEMSQQSSHRSTCSVTRAWRHKPPPHQPCYGMRTYPRHVVCMTTACISYIRQVLTTSLPLSNHHIAVAMTLSPLTIRLICAGLLSLCGIIVLAISAHVESSVRHVRFKCASFPDDHFFDRFGSLASAQRLLRTTPLLEPSRCFSRRCLSSAGLLPRMDCW